MAEKKHNLVYLTTNTINGRVYIGVHSTNELKDKYKGSGKMILRAFKKHGDYNLKYI